MQLLVSEVLQGKGIGFARWDHGIVRGLSGLSGVLGTRPVLGSRSLIRS